MLPHKERLHVKCLAFPKSEKTAPPPIPDENITSENKRENEIVFIKQIGNEKQNSTEQNPPISVFLRIIDENQNSANENNKAKGKIERIGSGRIEPKIITHVGVEDEQ